jgi:hypothetical protein
MFLDYCLNKSYAEILLYSFIYLHRRIITLFNVKRNLRGRILPECTAFKWYGKGLMDAGHTGRNSTQQSFQSTPPFRTCVYLNKPYFHGNIYSLIFKSRR